MDQCGFSCNKLNPLVHERLWGLTLHSSACLWPFSSSTSTLLWVHLKALSPAPGWSHAYANVAFYTVDNALIYHAEPIVNSPSRLIAHGFLYDKTIIILGLLTPFCKSHQSPIRLGLHYKLCAICLRKGAAPSFKWILMDIFYGDVCVKQKRTCPQMTVLFWQVHLLHLFCHFTTNGETGELQSAPDQTGSYEKKKACWSRTSGSLSAVSTPEKQRKRLPLEHVFMDQNFLKA